MKIEYEINFLDYWHISSGLSAGAKLDNMIVKDINNLPYVPGKTIKGLVREMAEYFENCDFINICFGGSSDENDKCYNKNFKDTEGICYFSNAILKDDIAQEIIKHNMQNSLYEVITSTKIDEKTKVAEDNSLREIEVVVPLTLYGVIENIPKQYEKDLQSSLKMVKRVGLNRNRGLGRCFIEIKESK